MSKIVFKYNPGSFVDYSESFNEEFIIDSCCFEYKKEYQANEGNIKDSLFASFSTYHDFKYKLDNYENNNLIRSITSLIFELEKELKNENQTDWFSYDIILDNKSSFSGSFSISLHEKFGKRLLELIANELPNDTLVPDFLKYFEEVK